jgi:hypothetical protein
MIKEGDLHRMGKNAEDAEGKELRRLFAEDGVNKKYMYIPRTCVYATTVYVFQ